ncbi:inorganic diphosphatase [Pontibacter cellulosilyticus]|uniref:inorganic diphosphatase n=1 Tax=Pontibacter cellulosilyticus TaxID=1720253 RepID=A0A923N7C3_9BACT|nr:inorganic diphosphatase [Pontibacter cellulosilyticus]MBC5993119.1 inorganic diphosphatase [Pontibacter cellulosilyticus]
MMHLRYTILLVSILLFTSCKTDYANLPTYTGTRQLQAVIEVPAGNSKQVKYDRGTQEFVSVKSAGREQKVEFLPYPGNYGFIPSTEIDKNGDSLPILVMSERAEAGTVMEVVALGIMQLETNGEIKPVVIAVPARPSERTIDATTLATFSRKYPAAQTILKEWFVNSSQTDDTKFVAWRNERFADKEILRWMKL